MKKEQPIFIVGNPRSGTTMFRLILCAHPQIIIPPEVNFITQFAFRYGSVSSLSRMMIDGLLTDLVERMDFERRWEISLDDFHANWAENLVGSSYSEFCSALMTYYSRSKGMPEKEYWGDKNVANRNYMTLIDLLYPSARFIHVVRDSRAVYASLKKLRNVVHTNAPSVPNSPSVFSALWLDSLNQVDWFATKARKNKVYTVRYEDIVEDFDETISGVCQFLSLPFDEAMSRFHETNRKHNMEPTEYDDWKWRTKQPLTPVRLKTWKKELTSEEIDVVTGLTFPMLKRHGYATYGVTQKVGDIAFWKQTLQLRIKTIARRGRVRKIGFERWWQR